MNVPFLFYVKQQKWNSKTTDLHGNSNISFIKWENQVLKYIKRMENNCQVPELVQAFPNVEKTYKIQIQRKIQNGTFSKCIWFVFDISKVIRYFKVFVCYHSLKFLNIGCCLNQSFHEHHDGCQMRSRICLNIRITWDYIYFGEERVTQS